jgi:hypothetical protein
MKLLRALVCFSVFVLRAGRKGDTIGIATLDVHESMMTAAAFPRQAKAGRYFLASVC